MSTTKCLLILFGLLAMGAASPLRAAANGHPDGDPAERATGAGATAEESAALAAAPEPGGIDGTGFAPADTSLGVAWNRWYDALQGAVVERTAASRPESAPLYPLDRQLPAEATAAKPYRHLAIAKAVTQLETAPAGRTHGAEGGGVPGGAASPLLALANARNYLNLSEYDKALEWYGQAAARDGAGNFRRETGREALAAAICARDTAAAGRAVAATLAFEDPAGREDEIVLAFRWLLNRGDRDTLGWLLQRTDTPAATADTRLAFWRAYALSWLDRRDESLAQLRGLLALGGEGRTLNERERGWVLTATADLLLMQGAAAEAGTLYDRLAASEMPALRRWGRLQSAGLAFVGHRYGDASAGYREICQSDRDGPWGAHACAMADIAAQLDRLMSEGEHHGAEPRQ